VFFFYNGWIIRVLVKEVSELKTSGKQLEQEVELMETVRVTKTAVDFVSFVPSLTIVL
jgi:hypothetical protein